MGEDKYPGLYSQELEKEAARGALAEGGDVYEEMNSLKEYIALLEAERDYYQEASLFAGVPNTPRPEKLLD